MAAALLLQQQRGLDVIGLDAANIVGFLKRPTGGDGVLTTAEHEFNLYSTCMKKEIKKSNSHHV